MSHLKRTPLSCARALRSRFESQIAKTWDDYYAEIRQREHGSIGPWINSYNFALLIQEQARCTFRAATVALGKVAPELFAEYWAALPRVAPSNRREPYKGPDGCQLFLCSGRRSGLPIYWVEDEAGKRKSKQFIGGADKFNEVLTDVR